MSNSPHPEFNYLPVTSWRYLPSTGSTNNDAIMWANEHAPDMALVVADQQTKGRGRADHTWVTNPGGALAFSLVLRPTQVEIPFINRFTALAALALVRALKNVYHLTAQIKWPNDVLLMNKKVAGILVETQWDEHDTNAIVLGMGVNVSSGSIPILKGFRIQPTCVEESFGEKIDRWQLLGQILTEIIAIRRIMPTSQFISLWNASLAFRGKSVTIHAPSGKSQQAIVLDVSENGSLLVKREDEIPLEIFAGELEVSYNLNHGRD